jgi:hypothetical protein
MEEGIMPAAIGDEGEEGPGGRRWDWGETDGCGNWGRVSSACYFCLTFSSHMSQPNRTTWIGSEAPVGGHHIYPWMPARKGLISSVVHQSGHNVIRAVMMLFVFLFAAEEPPGHSLFGPCRFCYLLFDCKILVRI